MITKYFHLPNMSGNVCYKTVTAILNQTPCMFLLLLTIFIVVLKKQWVFITIIKVQCSLRPFFFCPDTDHI